MSSRYRMHINPDTLKLTLKVLAALLIPTLLVLGIDRFLRLGSKDEPR